MQSIRVLVTTNAHMTLATHHVNGIKEAAPGVDLRIVNSKEATQEDIYWADVIFGAPKREWVAEAPRLKWLQLPTAGIDRWMGLRSDVLLTKASGTYGIPIAEWVVATMLMLSHRLHLYRDQQRQSLWKSRWGAREILGQTVGIVGLGDIGTEVAKRCCAMGCKVYGSSRTRPASRQDLDAWMVLDELIPQVDFLVLAVPGTTETRGLMSAERMGLMKKGSYLINVGRGSAIDEAALADAITSEHLAGAALDVTAVEPLPADSPLWQLEQVIITPHSSGDSPEANVDRLMQLFCTNLQRFHAGEPMINVVDRALGY